MTVPFKTIQSRVLIISDTHCAPLHPESSTPTYAFTHPLPKADLLIHCGDLTRHGALSEFEQALDLFYQIPATTKIVIAGNHDFALDRACEPRYANRHENFKVLAQEVHQLMIDPNGRAVREGVRYLPEGKHVIDLGNGARINVFAQPYTPRHWGAFQHDWDEDRYFGGDIGDTDIIISHGPPYGLRDVSIHNGHAGCRYLLRAMVESRPLIHCFGHIHEGHGVSRVEWVDDIGHGDSHAIDAEGEAQSTATHADNQHEERASEKAAKSSSRIGRLFKRKSDPEPSKVQRIERSSIGEYEATWRLKTKHIEDLTFDHDQVLQARAEYVDVTRAEPVDPPHDRQTLLVNAAIMDVHRRPVNAPVLIDIDLPVRP